ncbi:TonB-dependent receptor domain-containing protein [Pseudoduganella danionis]|uniref:TonB-dependent receptor plug domain-containing protein n=1 Tax=Pseudoduganella danionis TaxID=1890295 RepID=A0ABW9SHP3_9BURK|nr:TonB-dependent receptor [Pseudoduganella danionis]MTW31592.1 TonB-dependent receptor plug domain-containing protein [Pseudoduganella danionis]
MKFSAHPLHLLAAAGLSFAASAHAQTESDLHQEPRLKVLVTAMAEGLPARASGIGDTSQLLSAIAGYNVAQGGGVSGLPSVNGLADDRLKIRIDGMEITSACANHMNAPLSYIDPTQVGHIDVLAGVTPVSAGGDSIGGTITVRSAAPVYADTAGVLRSSGKLSFAGRSNGNGLSSGISASVASDTLSVGYNAAYARSHSYQDGSGQTVLASLYESINQAVLLGWRGDGQQLSVRLGTQHIPYQGYPNQYMDMTDNTGRYGNASYHARYGWGELDASAYWERTSHDMGFFTPERKGMMPMLTQGRNTGYSLKASLPQGDGALLRIGQEYHVFRLDDYWPAVAGSMMMGPQTYVNINGGQRDRLALYGEAETQHNAQWTSLFGARWESVRMDTGAVQPYASNMMNAADAAAAKAFNARTHKLRDNNYDLTALARYEADAASSYELAAARKTRSPNLYERYSWGRGKMAMTMTNWFGDGNGYVGNLDLRPETAYTLAATAHWHGGSGAHSWFVKFNPYYNRVQDYIDVDVLGQFNPYSQTAARGALLQFANHNAHLYGANLSWQLPLAAPAVLGTLNLNGTAAYNRGQRADGGALYHIMPLNTLLTLEQRSGAWTNQIELKLVRRKTQLDQRRIEAATAGYGLLALHTRYQLGKQLQLNAGISNLLDKTYADPLSGVYLSGLRATGGSLHALPGMGRSFDAGLSYSF